MASYAGGSPKAFFRECVSRSGFEIALKLDSTPVILEAEMQDDLPWAIFGCVRRTAGIMGAKSFFEIAGHADIALIWGRDALDEVDVLH